MSSAFLKALAVNETKKTSGYVVPRINELLMLRSNSEDRRDKLFHPSDLSYRFCPRAWSIYNYHPLGYLTKEGAVEPRLQRIFDNGNSLHTRLQGYLADMPGLLWGTWVRPFGYTLPGEQVSTEIRQRCFRPDGDGWRYGEVALRHEADRIVGSTDGLMLLDGEKVGFEAKSINSDRFKFLTADPADSHRDQTRIYMHCLHHQHTLMAAEGCATALELLPLTGFVVLYENKDTQEMKEFFVRYDAHQIATYIDSLRPLMHDALQFERTGKHCACRCPGKVSPLCLLR